MNILELCIQWTKLSIETGAEQTGSLWSFGSCLHQGFLLHLDVLHWWWNKKAQKHAFSDIPISDNLQLLSVFLHLLFFPHGRILAWWNRFSLYFSIFVFQMILVTTSLITSLKMRITYYWWTWSILENGPIKDPCLGSHWKFYIPSLQLNPWPYCGLLLLWWNTKTNELGVKVFIWPTLLYCCSLQR